MLANTFGTLFRLTTFGESHGPALGGVVDGCPPGIELDEGLVQRELDRRRPNQGAGTTSRQESDRVELLSGLYDGKTTGTAIGFIIRNNDQRSGDYDSLRDLFRPGHADYTYQAKFGLRDHRGGGRASGRETAARVAGGAVAQAVLQTIGIQVVAYTVEMGGVAAENRDLAGVEDREFFAAEASVIPAWQDRIKAIRGQGDSLGGVVEVVATGMIPGLGEPVFDKLDARLAYALMGVGAVKGVEVGAGFRAARLLGSENNDPILPQGFATNNAGGILGGISNGDAIVVRAAVKPIPSIAKEQITVDNANRPALIRVGGRHDACAIPRIVPVLKSMVCLVLTDMLLIHRSRRLG